MSDERSAIIKSTLDASGVKRGADEVKDAVRDVSRVVGAEGRKAAEGVEAIGEGAKRGATSLERETGRMVASLQRSQAAAEAGGRQTADYFEALAKQRGLNQDVLRPYIDGLRQAEAAQKAATGSLGTMGVSAKQTAAALRGVPAQFTDIITSLQGGQAPLTVFLQQGGQLKDMFGGAGNAARALGGYVLGLINPFTVFAAVAGLAATAFMMGSRESQDYSKALILSGNAAGVTAGRLGEMATAIAAVGPATQGKAAEILTQMAAAGAVGAINLERFTLAAINLERAGGPAAEETAKAFAQLARDPLAASIKLTESTRYLTAATAEQIAELERQGKTTEAARLAQEAYANAIDLRAPQLAAKLGLVERAWTAIKDATKQAGDAALGIGRADELATKLKKVSAEIAAFDAGASNLRVDADRGAQIAAQRKALVERQAFLQEEIRLEQRGVETGAARVRQDEAGLKWLKEGEKYLSAQARLQADITKIRNEGVAAGKTEAEIAERIAAAKTKSAPKDNSSRDEERRLEQQQRLIAELSGVTGTYVQDLQRLAAARAAGAVGEGQYLELVTALIERQPMVRDQMQDMARAAKEQAKATKDAADAYARYLTGLDRNLATGSQTLEQLRLELVELTAGKQARAELEQQERERLAITYEQAAIEADQEGKDSRRYRLLAAQVREEIRLRRSVASATADAEVGKANQKAAQDAAREWERTADQISQSLADAIFAGGKSAGDMIKSYFRSLVLTPTLTAIARPLTNTIGAALGLGGSALANAAGVAGAASGGSSLLGAAGGIGALFGAGGLSGALAAGAGWMTGAASLTQVLGASGSLIGTGTAGGVLSGLGMGLGALGPIALVAGLLGPALFGRKLKDTGFEGTFGSEGDFSGNAYQYYKGGLFRSNKTKRSALDHNLAGVLDVGGQAVYKQAQAYAEVLGLPADALVGYTQKIKVSLKGLSEDQAQQAVAKAVQDFQEGLIGRFSAQLGPLKRAGETLTQVAARVSELQIFSQAINALGGVFGRVASQSIDAREQLIALAGGMDAFSGMAQSFVQQYYSREEIAGVKARDVQGVLSAAGITQDVATKDQFRALVEGSDVSTASGREQLAKLLSIAGDFSAVADYLAETGGTLAGAAAFAPITGALADIFTQPQQAQVDAINTVAAGVQQVDASINRMAELFAAAQLYYNEVGGGA